MNILIVEDDEFKSDQISLVITKSLPTSVITIANSVHSAVKQINSTAFDFIILDMALPSHPVIAGFGAPLSMLTGGFEILFELQNLERTDSCIIITQYSSIEINRTDYPIKKSQDALTTQFGVSVTGCLQYSESDDSWKSDLIKLIAEK